MMSVSFSDDEDDSSIEALETLMLFRETIVRCRAPPEVHHEIPVPNPLNPFLPHVIESDSPPVHFSEQPFLARRPSFLRPPPVLLDVPAVPDPLAAFAACTSASQDSSMQSMPSESMQMHQQAESVEQKLQDTANASAGCSDDIKTHAYITNNENVSNTKSTIPLDNLQNASNSSQRGKKRQEINDLERSEINCNR